MTPVRKLPAERWKDYRSLRLEALRQSPLAFGSAPEEEESLTEREWKKRMRNVRFAMSEGAPVGMIECTFNDSVKFRHVAEIFGFYVGPGHRGKGIGAALLDHALGLARRRKGVIKVRLFVNINQRAAMTLYRKAGFAVVGRSEREMKVKGRLYTMLVMEKML